MSDLPQATRVYIGECMRCKGLAIYRAEWRQGEIYMLTEHRCTQCGFKLSNFKMTSRLVAGQLHIDLPRQDDVLILEMSPYAIIDSCTLDPDA